MERGRKEKRIGKATKHDENKQKSYNHLHFRSWAMRSSAQIRKWRFLPKITRKNVPICTAENTDEIIDENKSRAAFSSFVRFAPEIRNCGRT